MPKRVKSGMMKSVKIGGEDVGKLTGYEKIALVLTALFLVLCAVVFCMGRGEVRYTVTVSERSPETVFQAGGAQSDGTPDSLIPGEKINVNSAPAADLARLPGIGETRAQAVVTHREEKGPFQSAEELLAVSGIGEATLEKIRPYIEFG